LTEVDGSGEEDSRMKKSGSWTSEGLEVE